MLVKVCTQVVQAVPLTKFGRDLHEKRVTPLNTKDFRFLRFRAIGAGETDGANGNYDFFPYGEMETENSGFGYRTFINKRAHCEHNSSLGMRGSIGDLPDAYLNRFNYPEDVIKEKGAKPFWNDLVGKKFNEKRAAILAMPNQKDGAIEVLMRIDTNLVKSATIESKTRHLLERIVRMIDTGQRLTCSMGTNCQYSVCLSCGNEAKFASDYCSCLKNRKGSLNIVRANEVRDLLDREKVRPEWLKHVCASKADVDEILKGSSNKSVALRNIEANFGLSFFELSVVATPAFDKAIALEKIAKKNDMEREEYLQMLRKEIGDENLLDIYSLLQNDGKISTMCEVG